VIARIEGTGIKEPSKEAKVANLNFLRNPKKFLQDKIDKKLDSMTKSGKTPFGTNVGGSAVGEEGLGRFGSPNELSDASTTRFGNQFSPSVEVASADLSNLNFGNTFTNQAESNLAESSTGEAESLSEPGSEAFNQELKQYEQKVRKDTDMIDRYGTDELKNLTNEGKKRLEDSYKIYRDFNYERNPLQYRQGVDFSKKEKPSFGERISNLAGNVFNTITGTSSAEASQIPGGLPSGNQFSPSGDTSFSSFRMGGGVEGQQSGIVTPFSQTSMGKGEPRNITKFQDTSMGRKTVTVDGQQVAKNQTVASLPSDYKQTEAIEFAKAKAFQQAKKNPNVKVGVDSKGQPTATAVQKGRGEDGTSDRTAQGNQARVQQNAKARAQAAAYNRKMSGKSISQVKAANRQSMRDSAAERQKAFKKTGKSTVGARRAAAKKSVQAAAKKRNAAFKKRRAARRKSRRGRRGRRGGRR
tara:strand:- start:1899 stop:3305 length:1407 start_codon:yes stop_codon:yes gene_type:complete